MPKSKKKKNRDFQKVKLKVGKERRSGNETSISFKTRTIKVPQTLKDFSSSSSQEPHTKKRLTFEDLLKRCDANKSRNQRLSAVEGLSELALTTEPPFWANRFSPLMTKVATLLSDPEPEVRQGVIRLCRTLACKVDVMPSGVQYFDAQLCCALTHVSDFIRRDALVLFDLMLDMWPERLIKGYGRLVPALVNQISSYMVTNKTARRTLTVNPGSKLVSQKWRAEVLLRLSKIVETYVNKRRNDATPPPNHEQDVTFRFGVDCHTRGPCMPPSWKNLWTKWPLCRSSGRNEEYYFLASNGMQLQQFIISVFPLVKECWEEEFAVEDSVGPSYRASDSMRRLTSSSVPVLEAVVGLLHKFVECWCLVADSDHGYNKSSEYPWFQSEFLGQLRELLLPRFPISVTESQLKNKKGQHNKAPASGSDSLADDSPLQVSVLKLNLMVSEILASFPPVNRDWPSVWMEPEEWQEEVVTFLLKNLKRSIKAGLIGSITKVLRHVFFHYPYTEELGRLVTRVTKRFITAHPLSTEKTVWLDLLSELSFDLYERSPYHARTAHVAGGHIRHDLLEGYLRELPKMLLEFCGAENPEQMEQIANHVTKVMCSKGSEYLTDAILHHMPQLLDDKTGVFARLPQSCHQNMFQAIMWAYFYLPVPEAILKQMGLIIRCPHVDKVMARKLLEHVNMRFCELKFNAWHHAKPVDVQKDLEIRATEYLSFLFSVVVGHTTVELEAMEKAHTPETGRLTRIMWTCTTEQFEKHCYCVKDNFQYFTQYLKSKDPTLNGTGAYALDTMAEVWGTQILKKYRTLSVMTAWSALRHWHYMINSRLTKCQIMHADNPSCCTTPHTNPPEMWQNILNQTLPLFKRHLRPFTHLAFSVLYSLVTLEMEQKVAELPQGVQVEMFKAVVSLMEATLRMLVDLLQIITQFVQEQQRELESKKVTLLITKLLTAEELQCHLINYRDLLSPELKCFIAAVMGATPQVETTQWWQNFRSTCDQRISAASTGDFVFDR